MRRIKPAAIAFWIAAVILAVMIIVIGITGEGDDHNERDTLGRAVEQAAVECYALEGEYPMSVKYLEEHYGVTYDHEKYFVSYRTFGSNIRPMVKILDAPG